MFLTAINLSEIGIPINTWLLNCLLTFAISVILTGIIIPRILLISFRKNLFDLPDSRKIHQGKVPRLGGIAFMPALIMSLSSVMAVNMLNLDNPEMRVIAQTFNLDSESIHLCTGICALMILYLVGIADDLIGVKYRAKLVAQIISAVLIVSSGMTIDNLHGFFGIDELPAWAADSLTVVFIVLVVNAVNLIDGIDGLASGLCAIALGFYAWICFLSGNVTYSMVSMASLGTLVPFFYYNVFGSAKVGKKIFMGDTGALTTGLILSFVAIKVSRIDFVGYGLCDTAAILAFSPLVVPCLDVVRVFFHRISRGHSPFLPGRTHIHHKLLALGIRQRNAMLSILAMSAAYILMNILLSSYMSIELILATDFIVWVLGNLWLTKAIRRRQRRVPESRELYD